MPNGILRFDMASTPHISIRVPSSKLEEWRVACARNNIDVSSQIRKLMDAWVMVDEVSSSEETQLKAERLMLSFMEISELD
jgi:hypothetical protein